MEKILIAFLCGHSFIPSDFQNYPDDYAGYCPACVRAIMSQELNAADEDEEPDSTGVPEFNSDLPDDDDFEEAGNDADDLDAYEEEDQQVDEDVFADETEEDEDRTVAKIVSDLIN